MDAARLDEAQGLFEEGHLDAAADALRQLHLEAVEDDDHQALVEIDDVVSQMRSLLSGSELTGFDAVRYGLTADRGAELSEKWQPLTVAELRGLTDDQVSQRLERAHRRARLGAGTTSADDADLEGVGLLVVIPNLAGIIAAIAIHQAYHEQPGLWVLALYVLLITFVVTPLWLVFGVPPILKLVARSRSLGSFGRRIVRGLVLWITVLAPAVAMILPPLFSRP